MFALEKKNTMACKTPILIANHGYIPETMYKDSINLRGRRIRMLFTASLYGKTREDILSNLSNGRAFGDTTNHYIQVPCGHCRECIASRQNDIIQRCRYESENTYQFFCTLTYNPEHLPHYIIAHDDCPDDTILDIPYADNEHVKLLMKRLRNNGAFEGRPFRYLAVSERGTKKGRPHFHILFFVPKYEGDSQFLVDMMEHTMFDMVLKYWAKNIGTRKHPIYEPLLTYKRIVKYNKVFSNYDFHLVRPRSDKADSAVYFYCTKYMLKYAQSDKRIFKKLVDSGFSVEEAKAHMYNVRSRYVASRCFGLGFDNANLTDLPSSDDTDSSDIKERTSTLRNEIISSVRSLIRESILFERPYIFYYDTIGRSFPLAQYYVKKFLRMDEKISQYFNSRSSKPDNARDFISQTLIEYEQSQNKTNRIIQQLNDDDIDYDSLGL